MRAAVALIALFLFGLTLTPANPVPAQSEPADSQIKGALYDIERAEQQIPSLTPSRAANIKRLKRAVQMTEEWLKPSSNQGHPSWIDAAQRLATLKQALADLEAGRMPGTGPAATTAEEPAAPVPAATTTTSEEPAAPAASTTTTTSEEPAAPAAETTTSAQPTTPMGRWTLNQRFKTIQILEENIDK